MPKKSQKTILDSQSRELVIRLRDYFERERTNGGPLISIDRVVDRVAAALDIGRNTVSRITKEKFGETESAKDITNWSSVIFLDQTWLNANHPVGIMWTDAAHRSTKMPEREKVSLPKETRPHHLRRTKC
ncbi:uncharacterized protein LOC113502754 [Trichoplusia ni]|uniref:Uncharacterized protein LOC113502754 n=1 Tax=Trichoplusia ni TaxID=7111 RepID=A0A7E5WHK0_TRINI|nr:uncharacterized protein LOC113502754 [Trichoplusia ni]